MSKQTEALKLALEALESCDEGDWSTGHVIHPSYDEDAVKQAMIAIEEALAQPEQEPVAWLHTKIEGVTVPHRPADLDKHPDRWEALYKTPSPCPTCEALARTVMLDQTSHDTTPPQRPSRSDMTWVGLTDEDKKEYVAQDFGGNRLDAMDWAEKRLKEKNT